MGSNTIRNVILSSPLAEGKCAPKSDEKKLSKLLSVTIGCVVGVDPSS